MRETIIIRARVYDYGRRAVVLFFFFIVANFVTVAAAEARRAGVKIAFDFYGGGGVVVPCVYPPCVDLLVARRTKKQKSKNKITNK